MPNTPTTRVDKHSIQTVEKRNEECEIERVALLFTLTLCTLSAWARSPADVTNEGLRSDPVIY